ncbi:hypothetical protein [uncultured Draconibacterium sp.]|uniref:hypothetical protein n=1 Tax=uncultured Draconibacterium sp. TaxID=1573823 RepID=UPI0029C6ECB3|nr:hypothetical protein [uncultured Draconibacterium sp.]
MRTKLINQTLGYLKLFSVAIIVVSAIMTLFTKDSWTYSELESLFAFVLLIVFCIYLMQSGWTQVKMKNLRSRFLVFTGLSIGAFIIAIWIFYIVENGVLNFTVIHIIILTLVTFMVNDVLRLRAQNRNDKV